MKTFIFPYGGSFGKGDSWDNTVEAELTDEEAALLERSARGGSKDELTGDPELAGIYDKVYIAAYNQEIRLVPDFVIDEIRRDEYRGDKRISDKRIAEGYLARTTFRIFYPEELR